MNRIVCLLCLSWAGSVSAQEAPPPPPPERPAECVPACRSGFMCSGGQCVSRCNPPCEAGARCLENGECSAAARQAPSTAPVGQRVNRGWATGAGVLAAVSAGVIVLLTGVTIAFNGDDVANYTGAATLLSAGILLPIAAVGAGSGRWDASITGAVGWRILAWVSFGFAMSVGVLASALGFAGIPFPSYGIAALGGLGVVSALSFMADAFITAGQGRELLRQQPVISLLPDARGGVAGSIGWAVAF